MDGLRINGNNYTRHSAYVGLMLVHLLRRWPNIKPAKPNMSCLLEEDLKFTQINKLTKLSRLKYVCMRAECTNHITTR